MDVSAMLDHSPKVNEEEKGHDAEPSKAASGVTANGEGTVYAQNLPYLGGLDGVKDGATVKEEPPDSIPIPSASTPTAVKNDSMDEETLKAIAAARNDLGMRSRAPPPKLATDIAKSASPASTPTDNAPIKKRPPPKSATKRLSVGTNGPKKPPSKKRKIEANGSNRATPASSARRSVSETPTADNVASEDDGGTDTDPDQVYCICRKPDNHTWMLGCEGGCDDWFHGKCVNMRKEDEQLIDNFICPTCEKTSKTVTTWLPMCRRNGCRNPARVKLKKSNKSAPSMPSKYCSDGCGVMFMKATLARAPPSPKSSRKTHANDKIGLVGPLGGPIRSTELKALITSMSSFEAFRELGSKMHDLPTPPPSQSPDLSRTSTLNETYFNPSDVKATEYYNQSESQRLAAIAARKAQLRQQKLLHKDRQHFVTLVKERIAREAEKIGAALRDFCWFDHRVAWDDTTFAAWRESEEGKRTFDENRLEAPPESLTTPSRSDDINGTTDNPQPEGEVTVDTPEADQEDSSTEKKSKSKTKKLTKPKALPSDVPSDLCNNKTCRRHQGWQKMVLQDSRFEEACVGDEMRRIDTEEKEIKKSAEIRRMHENLAAEHGNDDGYAEAVEEQLEGEGEPVVVVESETV